MNHRTCSASWFCVYVATGVLFCVSVLVRSHDWLTGDRGMVLSMAAGALFLCLLSGASGPLFIVPGLAAVFAMAHLHFQDRHRMLTIALACVPVVLPLLAQWAGLWPPFYAFDERGMTVLARLCRLPEVPTTAILVGANLLTIGTAGLFATRARADLRDAERTVGVQAWQLRQLVPPTTVPA